MNDNDKVAIDECLARRSEDGTVDLDVIIDVAEKYDIYPLRLDDLVDARIAFMEANKEEVEV